MIYIHTVLPNITAVLGTAKMLHRTPSVPRPLAEDP